MSHDIDEVAYAAHANAVDKGFWDEHDKDNPTVFYLSRIALIHSEASEILEAIRKEKGDEEVVEEIADTIIRLFDLWGGLVQDGYTKKRISDAIFEKMAKNRQRPKMHGNLA